MSKANTHLPKTADRIRRAMQEKNIRVFAEIDHAAAARAAGLPLRNTLLFIAGNPNAGTPIMQENQEAAIELPVKVLLYDDEKGDTYILYKNISPMQNTYQLKQAQTVTEKIDAAMSGLIKKVAG